MKGQGIPEHGSVGFYKEPVKCQLCDRKTYLYVVEVFIIPPDQWIEHPLCPRHYAEHIEFVRLLGVNQKLAFDLVWKGREV